MYKYLIGVMMVLGMNATYGHNANEAFYTITQSKTGYLVKAELPWTLRTALLNYDVSLQHATAKSDYEAAFKNYMVDHMSLFDANGLEFRLLGIEEVENEGHSHQSTYHLYYDGQALHGLENTVFFELFDDQKNYHEVVIDDNKYTWVTSHGNPTATIDAKVVGERAYLYILLLLGGVVLGMTTIFIIKKNKIKVK